jgi:hypothetical protein
MVDWCFLFGSGLSGQQVSPARVSLRLANPGACIVKAIPYLLDWFARIIPVSEDRELLSREVRVT